MKPEERWKEYQIQFANGELMSEDVPYVVEGDALQELQRQRKHLESLGVPVEFQPVLVEREIVMTTGSWKPRGE